ncbi:unnamed protein product [Polarella glacialis]|uniref:Uncharacterized protein n=1 Tax=Polarella glacialis TaxID=89957 RepID=A0A813M1K2_POLGL|nr:unnamed protein product [Polarella glacialis]
MPDILKQRPKSDVPQAVAVMTRWTEQDPSSGEESEGRTTQITREESANLQPLPQALLCTVLPGSGVTTLLDIVEDDSALVCLAPHLSSSHQRSLRLYCWLMNTDLLTD